jgi:hypothetical protein
VRARLPRRALGRQDRDDVRTPQPTRSALGLITSGRLAVAQPKSGSKIATRLPRRRRGSLDGRLLRGRQRGSALDSRRGRPRATQRTTACRLCTRARRGSNPKKAPTKRARRLSTTIEECSDLLLMQSAAAERRRIVDGRHTLSAKAVASGSRLARRTEGRAKARCSPGCYPTIPRLQVARMWPHLRRLQSLPDSSVPAQPSRCSPCAHKAPVLERKHRRHRTSDRQAGAPRPNPSARRHGC